ncbi:MAG: hypothetical protein WCI18_02255 [Pseudomonadota bacterium]
MEVVWASSVIVRMLMDDEATGLTMEDNGVEKLIFRTISRMHNLRVRFH